MDFRKLKRSISEKGYTVIAPMVTSRQRLTFDLISNSINTPKNTTVSLTDSDGVQQFILGITPMNSSVRVGHGPA